MHRDTCTRGHSASDVSEKLADPREGSVGHLYALSGLAAGVKCASQPQHCSVQAATFGAIIVLGCMLHGRCRALCSTCLIVQRLMARSNAFWACASRDDSHTASACNCDAEASYLEGVLPLWRRRSGGHGQCSRGQLRACSTEGRPHLLPKQIGLRHILLEAAHTSSSFGNEVSQLMLNLLLDPAQMSVSLPLCLKTAGSCWRWCSRCDERTRSHPDDPGPQLHKPRCRHGLDQRYPSWSHCSLEIPQGWYREGACHSAGSMVHAQ